jgi:hypothetical protein
MKTKISSWIIAGAYLLFGVWLYLAIPRFQGLFSGFNIRLSFLTRVALVVGPNGWLLLAVAAGTAVVLKDRRFYSRLWNPLFTLLFLLWVGGMAVALIFFPFCAMTQIP